MTDQTGTELKPESPLARALRLSRGAFVAVFVFSFFLNLLFLTSPLYMLQVYDRVLASGHHETLLYLTLIALAALVVLGLLEGLRQSVLSRFGAWLHGQVSGPVLNASLGAQLAGGGGGAQGLRELATLQQFAASRAILPVFDAPWSPIFIAVIWMLHPWLGMFALVATLGLFFTAWLNDRITRAALEAAGKVGSSAQAMADHALANGEAIRAMGMMAALTARYRMLAGKAQAASANAGERGGWVTGASRFLRLALQVGILGLGALLVLDGRLTPGGMIAGSILLSRALAPVEQSIGAWRSFRQAREAQNRLEQLFEHFTPARGQMPLPTPTGRLDVQALSVRAPGAARLILHDVSLQLGAGESLAIIGPSAAGKSTLIRALAGVAAPAGGHVRLDGADLAQYPEVQLGAAIGYLPQAVELFDGTVRENIARFTEAEPEAVIAAAQLAGVHDMITALPEGYETEIGRGGAHLSGGQRQRIGLARAVFGDPALVLLDEPAANLDQAGEIALERAVRALKARGTSLVMVAHRAAHIASIDKVAVLAGGRLELFGPREDVLAALQKSPPTPAPRTAAIQARSAQQ